MSKCKYAMREHQVSYDDGLTWTPLEVIKGDLIEYQSADCPDSGSEITKWVDLENDFLCEENRKYKKQVLYVSYDNGITWYIYFPTVYQKGEYVGVDNEFCAEKFEGNYATGSGEILDPWADPLKIVKCNDSSTLSSAETQYYVSNYTLISGKVGNCVERIGDRAFVNCDRLSSITISDSVKEIGISAFNNCSGLTSINIPSGVTSIGNVAFAYCTSLTSINIPNSVTSIGDGAFNACTSLPVVGNIRYADTYAVGATNKSLSTYTLKNNTKWIGVGAFYNCSGLTSINIPSGVTSIGTQAFGYCSSLTSVTVKGTTPPELGANAFIGTNNCPIYTPCSSVETFKSAWSTYANRILPNIDCEYNAKVILEYNNGTAIKMPCNSSSELTYNEIRNFFTARQITSATIGNCVTTIGTSAFTSCIGITSVDIPNSVTSIGRGAFDYCWSLTSITIPSSVTSIGRNAFLSCSGLTSCLIGSGVTSIDGYAFKDCTSLTSIDIPSGVTSIGDLAFYNCSSLASVTVNAITPPTLGTGVFASTIEYPIYVPSGSLNAYKSATNWDDYASRIRAIP